MGEVTLYMMTPDPKPKRWRKRYGYYGVGEDGTIYLPAELAASPMEVLLCAGYERVHAVVTADNVTLYPSEWLAREFPKAADAVAKIVTRIKRDGPKKEGQ